MDGFGITKKLLTLKATRGFINLHQLQSGIAISKKIKHDRIYQNIMMLILYRHIAQPYKNREQLLYTKEKEQFTPASTEHLRHICFFSPASTHTLSF